MDVLIEVTRECNLTCEHCLRGEAENKVIQAKDIIALFKAIKEHKGQEILTLTLTGGEPALRPYVIQMILDYAKFYEIDIGNFYIATNGTIASDEFLKVLMELYLYCSDNEISYVDISNDTFHNMELIQKNIKKFQMFSFIQFKFKPKPKHEGDVDSFPNYIYDYKDFDPSYIFNQGRGQDWGEKPPNQILFSDFEENPESIEFYLNVNGDIILGCNWSYEEQEEHKLCSVANIGTYLEILKGWEQKTQ